MTEDQPKPIEMYWKIQWRYGDSPELTGDITDHWLTIGRDSYDSLHVAKADMKWWGGRLSVYGDDVIIRLLVFVTSVQQYETFGGD